MGEEFAGSMSSFQDLNDAEAYEEVERGVFKSIDRRRPEVSEERPLLSIHDDWHFRRLSDIYFPSPASDEQETRTAARRMALPENKFRDIVRSKILKKEAGLINSVELRHALDPSKPKTADMFHDMLIQETSQKDLLAVKNPPPNTVEANMRRASLLMTEQEPLLDRGSPTPSYSSQESGSGRRVRQLYRRHPSRGERFCKCLAVFFCRPFLWLGIGCFAFSFVFYHYLKDASIDLFNNAPMSWWINFAGRQMITLQIALWAQYILIDFLILSFKPIAKLLGPLVTVWAIQSRGFNFTISAWGITNALILHGDNKFQSNWFYWTGLDIFGHTEYGAKILSSTLYSRIVIAMIAAGFISSIKRTWFGVTFDRKILKRFKPRLQALLKDIFVLTELADLAYEAQKHAFTVQSSLGTKGEADQLLETVKTKKGSMRKELEVNFALEPLQSSEDEDNDGNNLDPELREMKKEAAADNLQRTSSGALMIKDKLDRWIPPETKGDSGPEASIREVLSFRRVLLIMDLSCPFGDSFGKASSRDECIASAHRVYEHLLLLNPEGALMLSFQVIAAFAYDNEGVLDKAKLYQLRRVFRPDGNNEIGLLAFVQSCDTLYRRFRYFRASVTNASVLDQVVESMFDKFFYSVMVLVVLAYLGLNPMPILLSLSTLLVSLSFAMGSSAASFVEGVSLILVRSPYDLGDRIILTNPLVDGQPLIENSYLVSDINLHSTTLTHTGTNQVSTVKNGSLKDARIVNLNRSGNGLVRFDVDMSLSILEDNRLAVLSEDVSQYCRDNPRSWDNLLVLRIQSLDAVQEKVTVRLIIRHRNAWQDAARIMRDRGLLLQHIYEASRNRGFHYVTSPSSRIIYMGGKLVDVADNRTELLNKGNVRVMESSNFPVGA